MVAVLGDALLSRVVLRDNSAFVFLATALACAYSESHDGRISHGPFLGGCWPDHHD
jgi:hypothetical protein